MDEAIIVEQVEEKRRQFNLSMPSDQHPYHLSMGQKRRLSVAAAMMRKPKLLLLDEPTFGQDAQNTFAIVHDLEQLRLQGTTIMMVTHDEAIVQHFSTAVWEVAQGQVRCYANVKEWGARHDRLA